MWNKWSTKNPIHPVQYLQFEKENPKIEAVVATIHNLGCVLVPRGDFGLAWLAKKMSSNAFAHNWQTFLHRPKNLHSLRKQLRSVLFFCSMVKKKTDMPQEFLALERCHSASPKSIFCWWLFNSLGAIARLSKIVQNMRHYTTISTLVLCTNKCRFFREKWKIFLV